MKPNYNKYKIYCTNKKSFKDNELIFYKKYNDLAMLEIRSWKDIYEIYYRPKTKIYGYCLIRISTLNIALNIVKNINDEYLKNYFSKLDKNLF